MRKLFFFLLLSFSVTAWAQQMEHKVQRGETYASIAQKYGVTEAALRKANGNKATAYVGMTIKIPQAKTTTAVKNQQNTTQVTAVSTNQPTAVPKKENAKPVKVEKTIASTKRSKLTDEERAERKARRKARWQAFGSALSGVGKALSATASGLSAANDVSQNGGSTLDAINSGLTGAGNSLQGNEYEPAQREYSTARVPNSQNPQIASLEAQIRRLKIEYNDLKAQYDAVGDQARQTNKAKMDQLNNMYRQTKPKTSGYDPKAIHSSGTSYYALTRTTSRDIKAKSIVGEIGARNRQASNNQGAIAKQMSDLAMEIYRLENQLAELKGQSTGYNDNSNTNSENSIHAKHAKKIKCTICNETGKCKTCGGRGWRAKKAGIYEDCKTCHGNARCSNCNGKGYRYIEHGYKVD